MNKVDVLLKRDDNTGSEASERAFLENSKKLALINGALTQSVKPYVWKVTFIGQKRQ